MTDHRAFRLRRLVGSPGAGRDPVVLGHQSPVRLAGGGQFLLALLRARSGCPITSESRTTPPFPRTGHGG